MPGGYGREQKAMFGTGNRLESDANDELISTLPTVNRKVCFMQYESWCSVENTVIYL